MSEHEFDIVVIGMGPGGEDAAEHLADAGLQVAGVEARLVGVPVLGLHSVQDDDPCGEPAGRGTQDPWHGRGRHGAVRLGASRRPDQG